MRLAHTLGRCPELLTCKAENHPSSARRAVVRSFELHNHNVASWSTEQKEAHTVILEHIRSDHPLQVYIFRGSYVIYHITYACYLRDLDNNVLRTGSEWPTSLAGMFDVVALEGCEYTGSRVSGS